MTYGELRSFIQNTLNRSDCDDNLTDQFITMALRRTDRLLRTPLQRVIAYDTVDSGWIGYKPVPTDFLGLYKVVVNGDELPRITANQRHLYEGFRVEDAKFIFTPDLKEGDELEIEYYSEFAVNPASDEITRYSLVLPDVILFGTLSYAGTYFRHEDRIEWDQRYQALISEAQMMADRDDMAGGMFISPYGGGMA